MYLHNAAAQGLNHNRWELNSTGDRRSSSEQVLVVHSSIHVPARSCVGALNLVFAGVNGTCS